MRGGSAMGFEGRLRVLRSIWGLGLACVVLGLAATGAWADFEDIPEVPRSQDIQMAETCLNGIDARGGQSAESCLGKVERACEEEFGSNTLELSRCLLLEARTWAVLLDRALAYNVQQAQLVDAQCATKAWNRLCQLEPDGVSRVEETLRRAQVAWVAMLSTTCDYRYKLVQQTSAREPDHAACLRRLVFERQQLFWRHDSAGCDCNIDLQLQGLHYDGEVVPFAFRRPAP
ncbi:hypothetical protein GC209_11730 [bacterium]|nr:hypothetical protein [bacterium]